MMKLNFFILILLVILFTGCKYQTKKKEIVEPDFYKNLFTQEILNKYEFSDFYQSLKKEYYDSIQGSPHINLKFESLIDTEDSIIQPFKYDIRVGIEYKVRSKDYKKIGMNIPAKTLQTINGDSVLIGGIQDKPTVINLWFIRCGGCVAEIPALNRLQEKYADKVNFIALTFDNDKDVRRFLKKTSFSYTHVASKNWKKEETSLRPYIETIESYPFPENIFIDKNGTIRYIEGMIPRNEDIELEIKHFEMIIKKLLNE